MEISSYLKEGAQVPARIAVLSDTHGLLRPEVLRIVRTCDCILHGGDINKPEILDELRTIAPLYVVRGNNDKDWAKDLPQSLSVTLEGVSFFIVHNKKDVPLELGTAQIVVFGHSHKYFEQELNGLLWLNPGSCGPRRFDQPITMAVIEAEQGRYHTEKIIIPPDETGVQRRKVK
ncbi:MAG: metallophosphoesterase family protein [Oscillospiraceae bacterium]|nr:metallophosphoesterase family protein [Oscillospiraceae bacterium]